MSNLVYDVEALFTFPTVLFPIITTGVLLVAYGAVALWLVRAIVIELRATQGATCARRTLSTHLLVLLMSKLMHVCAPCSYCTALCCGLTPLPAAPTRSDCRYRSMCRLGNRRRHALRPECTCAHVVVRTLQLLRAYSRRVSGVSLFRRRARCALVQHRGDSRCVLGRGALVGNTGRHEASCGAHQKVLLD